MSQRCGTCGRKFRYMEIPGGGGTITGCPKCLDNPKTIEALQAMVKAVHKEFERRAPTDSEAEDG